MSRSATGDEKTRLKSTEGNFYPDVVEDAADRTARAAESKKFCTAVVRRLVQGRSHATTQRWWWNEIKIRNRGRRLFIGLILVVST